MEMIQELRLKREFKKVFNIRVLRGFLSIVMFVVLWQLVVFIKVPYLENLPYPKDVAAGAADAAGSRTYWFGWGISLIRIFVGFIMAQLIGIPLGLAMGISRTFKDFTFPVFEMLRPIPPIAWIPLAILFWPTRELSIYFLVFIGAFFIIVINVIQGVSNISVSLKWAASSLGARPKHIFWRILVPGSLPSIITGMTVGMGVTWNVLIAAEMIAGQGGLGRMTWEAYTNNNIPFIVVGMVSIGVAGYLCSTLVRWLGEKAMPWKKRF
ncbi:MAG: ABC transporter permease [Nitrospirae bacterium]|nr:ABC transporter permease [Nitrospirota bacterium]